MKALGQAATKPARIFLVGGATAVLCGWRESTIDIDLKIQAGSEDVLKGIPGLKERLQVNVELASPDDFIPPLPSWEDRSRFIRQEGKLTFLHYDFYAQALAKIERGHRMDLLDVQAMIDQKLIDVKRLLEFFAAIEPEIYRYPAIDARKFRSSVEHFVQEQGGINKD
jgi:hypothetical protein